MAQCCARKAWKERVTWTGVCQLLQEQKGVHGHWAAPPTSFNLMSWVESLPCSETQHKVFPLPWHGIYSTAAEQPQDQCFSSSLPKITLSKGSNHAGFGGAHRNSGFVAGSKLSYCFEVITVINTKCTRIQMYLSCFPHFWVLFGIEAEFLQFWFFLILTMPCLQDLGAFSAPLFSAPFFISAGPDINILQDKNISHFLCMVSSPEPTVPLVSSFAILCHCFLLFPLLSGRLEQPPKLSKAPPDDQ